MSRRLRKLLLGFVAGVALVASGVAGGAITMTSVLLPVSNGALAPGEWNSNFGGALAAADAYNIPLLVFYGGLSCGKCEELQLACMTEEFLSWQEKHKILMVFTTNNGSGNASAFAKPQNSTGYPFIAVYWNRDGAKPAKDSEYYRTFNGRDGEMLVQGGSLAAQLIGSIETVAGGYDFSSNPDMSERAELLYAEPVATSLFYGVGLFAGLDAADAFAPQTVYNLTGVAAPKLKSVSGSLPPGVKLVCKDGVLSLAGSAKRTGEYAYSFSIEQKRNGIVHTGPAITLSFKVAAADDVSAGGCAMLGKAFKATVPLLSGGEGVPAGTLDISVSARNSIKAKFTSLYRSTARFSGGWSSIADGSASAALVSGDKTLSVQIASDGSFKAVLSDPASGSAFESPGGLKAGAGTYAAVSGGAYVVALPETVASGTGSGYVCIKKLAPTGKVAWSGVLGNGQKISGGAFAMTDADGNVVVHLFKTISKACISAVLRFQNGNIAALDGTRAVWSASAAPSPLHECAVRGCRYEKSAALDALSGGPLQLRADTAGFTSGLYGAVVSAPSAAVSAAGGKLALVERSKELKLTFAKATGEFKGSMRVSFEGGQTVAKFSGVLLAGGLGPSALGTAWFSDVEGGVPAKRGFDVTIEGGAR